MPVSVLAFLIIFIHGELAFLSGAIIYRPKYKLFFIKDQYFL
ncbi:hypothetical protein ELI_0123 [Eubacterium callanderi]|uniref:Uncharacterized protein n=1 Tax=Eubacterium callanderi TaxID=53442 RepID=E3GHJ0_9FIRM|nr:hypothetical protein ELI_0123 [Eubacterium callanderi]